MPLVSNVQCPSHGLEGAVVSNHDRLVRRDVLDILHTCVNSAGKKAGICIGRLLLALLEKPLFVKAVLKTYANTT